MVERFTVGMGSAAGHVAEGRQPEWGDGSGSSAAMPDGGSRERSGDYLVSFPRSLDLSRMEIRLPLIAAMLILFSAVATAQFAIYWQSRDVAQRTARLGAVYLDNLAANVAPRIARGEIDSVVRALQRTLSYDEGIRDESLYLLDVKGKLVAQARRDGAPSFEDVPQLVFQRAQGTYESPEGGIAWVWRPLVADGVVMGTLIAALDVSPLNERGRLLSFYVMLAAMVVSIVVAVAGMWFLRRQLHPVSVVATHLEDVANGRLRSIPEMERPNEILEKLRSAFNQMVAATLERETLARRMAEQSRAAVLGRLAATIVHEVKNPLGGMQTAVETIKKYGDNVAVRAEAVGLIERGLETVEQVIDATLESYKVPDKRRALSTTDIADVGTLIEAEARQRGIIFSVDVRIPKVVAVPAVETRQVLLNLLLNACRATPRGGTVSLTGNLAEGLVTFEVRDSGAGLDASISRALQSGDMLEGEGLGLPIVRRLVDRLSGGISASTLPAGGTSVVVRVPLTPLEIAT